MSRNSRRAAAVAITGVFAVAPMVTACAAGQNPQSAMPTQLVEGVNASAHQVVVRNLFVLGPEPGQTLAAGGSAPVYASIVNEAAAPDRLLGIEVPGSAQPAEISGGGLDLPPAQLVSTGTQESGQTASKVIFRGLTRALTGGETLKLVFRFQRAGSLNVNVPVLNRQGDYTTYAPAPTVSPTPTATTPPGTRPSRSPSAPQSGSPGAKPDKPKKKKPTPTPVSG